MGGGKSKWGGHGKRVKVVRRGEGGIGGGWLSLDVGDLQHGKREIRNSFQETMWKCHGAC